MNMKYAIQAESILSEKREVRSTERSSDKEKNRRFKKQFTISPVQ